jgi:Ca2+/Na+ antiporter
VILIAIYGLYLLLMFRMPSADEEGGELPLVPRKIRTLTVFRQKWVIALFFAAGGALLLFSVEPFYHNTVELGASLGLSTYFLLQWIAPFLSEFPEFITIAYWGRTGRAQLGVTNAISSNVNQLTLLIAMIPIVYVATTYARGAVILNVVFDPSQRLEIFLTAAQALFAASALLNLRFHRWEAWTLFLLWAVQLFDPLIDKYVPPSWPHLFPAPIPSVDNPHYTQYVREYVAYLFLALTPIVLFAPKKRFAALTGFRTVWRTHLSTPPPAEAPATPR